MSRQDKAITEKHTKILRELLKRPENKLCADCKRNDPRWASWNLGLFLCIRCSGIHRGMGTHISKVKSVDLDVWTPEQMTSIQNWGNRRANAYWEAHLKAGHVPPDHKMESFVRSKYESRRWALDGPPPDDPSALEDRPTSAMPVIQQSVAQSSTSRPMHVSNDSRRPASPVVQPTVTTRQAQAHQLLSTAMAERDQPRILPPVVSSQLPQPPQPPQPSQNDLFTLDFHSLSPNSVTPEQPKKIVKQDILSLFSAPVASVPSASLGYGQFGAAPQQSIWAADIGSAQQRLVPLTSMGGWGAAPGLNGAMVAPPHMNMWENLPTQQSMQQPPAHPHPETTNLWGSSTPTGLSSGDLFGNSLTQAPQKKDDVFGDLWGGFK